MKYSTSAAFRAALEDRLRDRAARSRKAIVRLRKSVVFDRLLARLIAVAPDRWMLKGAVVLDLRYSGASRSTMDVDLGRYDDETGSTTDLIAAQRLELDDHFVFAIERTARLDQLREGAAVRYHAICELAGRVFEEVLVDIGFGTSLPRALERVQGTDLLAFAGIDRIVVPAIPLVFHVAEKLHAYTRDYGPDGIRSTRVKDLVDLVLIEQRSRLAAVDVRDAIDETFKSRGDAAIPKSFPAPPAEWSVPYRRLAADAEVTADINKAVAEVFAFLGPVLDGSATGDWDPATRAWMRV